MGEKFDSGKQHLYSSHALTASSMSSSASRVYRAHHVAERARCSLRANFKLYRNARLSKKVALTFKKTLSVLDRRASLYSSLGLTALLTN